MDTKSWGPGAWRFMFITVANYPLEINERNRLHVAKKRYYKNFLIGMKDILPCKYCRRSYSKFIKELPINKFLGSRQKLMYWLYLIKDKVNKKLIAQGNMHTKPSPPFEEICKYYEKYRAHCSDKTKSCRKPKI